MDEITLARIDLLHPKLRDEAKKMYIEANNKLGKSRLRFSYTLRTFAEQKALYEQGRSKKGAIVTNSKAGESYHNYGLAVDIVMLIDKDGNGTYETASWNTVTDWDKDATADWQEVVQVFTKYGWQWGFIRNGKRWDLPHFQKTFGLHWSELLKRKNAGKVDKNGYVII